MESDTKETKLLNVFQGGVNHHSDNPVVPEKAPDKARGETFGHSK